MVGDEGEGLTEQADATQSWVFIDQLENAQNFEVGPCNKPNSSIVLHVVWVFL